jgi:hypothetical protein
MVRREYSDEIKAQVMALAGAGYVYGLRHTDSDRYFYVGCSKYLSEHRLAAHLYAVESGTHSNTHFANTVKKYGADNIVCDTLEVTTAANRFEAERRWIDKLKAEGHRLVNRIHNDVEHRFDTYRTYQLPYERWLQLLEIVSKPPPRKKAKYQPLADELHALLRDLVAIAYELKLYPWLQEGDCDGTPEQANA